jgi:hypothetical protein
VVRKEVPMYNLNIVSAKGDVEFFNKIMLQNKIKGVESDFFGESITFSLDIELGKDYNHWEK